MARPIEIPDDEFSVASTGEDLVVEGYTEFEEEGRQRKGS